MIEAKSLIDEQYREYDFGNRVYKILSPVALWTGVTTHRVLDANGTVHCVPIPGSYGCVLRWLPKDETQPVQF